MISVSNDFKQAILNRDQPWVEEIVLNRTDWQEPLTIGAGSLWQNGIVIEDSIMPQNSFTLGGSIINKATVTLNNLNGQFDNVNFLNAEMRIYIGLQLADPPALPEMIQKGWYFIRDVKYQNGLIVLTAYDGMNLFDRPFKDCVYGLPLRADELIYQMLEDCWGIPYYVTLPHNFDIYHRIDPGNLTYKDVLRYIGEKIGCFFRFDNTGTLQALVPDIGGLHPYIVNGIYNSNLSFGDYEITGIFIYVPQSGQNEYTEYFVGTNESALIVKDNPFIEDSDATTVRGWLQTAYMSKPFATGDITHLSNPCLEAGDALYIPDAEQPGFYRLSFVGSTTFGTAMTQNTSCASINSTPYSGGSGGTTATVVSDPSIKRSDIVFNVAATVGTDSTSVPNNTAYDKGNFTLDAGVYSVTCTVIFAANATGNRRAWLSRTSGGSAISSVAEVHIAATPSGSTQFQFTCYLSPQVATTYYLVVQQNSGSSLNCTTRVAYLGVRK